MTEQKINPEMPASGLNWKSLLTNLKPILKSLWDKFYSNKKIFWPVSIGLGFLFLLILLAAVSAKIRSTQTTRVTPSPSPFILSTPKASGSSDVLIKSQTKLEDLKNQINNLDVHQSRLTPPVLNFDIQF
jgi:hypothetical protein